MWTFCVAFSRRECNLFHAALSPEDVPIFFLGEKWSYCLSRTAPRIKAPPFSDRDIGHSYNNGGEREDMIFLVCKALYKCSGLTILAQETA